MDIREMRRRISEVYDGLGWKKKVANMPDMQVYAIYKEFEKSGKFRTERQLQALKRHSEEENGHQMDINDMWPDNLYIKKEEN